MKPPKDYALYYEFDVKILRRRQFSGLATIFRPQRKPTGEWACRLVLQAVQKEEQVVYGEDSLQALMLALQCLEFLFARLRKSGVSIRYLGSKDEVDFELYFRGSSNQTTEPN